MKTALKIVLALLQVRTGVELGKAGSHVSAAADFGGSMGMNFAAIESVCEDTRHLDDAGQVIGTTGWVGVWYSTRAIATDDETNRKVFWTLLAGSYLSAVLLRSQRPLRLVQRMAQVGSGLGIADVGRVQSLPRVRRLGLITAGLSGASALLTVVKPSKLKMLSQRALDVVAAYVLAEATQKIANDVRAKRI